MYINDSVTNPRFKHHRERQKKYFKHLLFSLEDPICIYIYRSMEHVVYETKFVL